MCLKYMFHSYYSMVKIFHQLSSVPLTTQCMRFAITLFVNSLPSKPGKTMDEAFSNL